jgi:hypothetical protein
MDLGLSLLLWMVTASAEGDPFAAVPVIDLDRTTRVALTRERGRPGLAPVTWLSRRLCKPRAHVDGRTTEARLLAVTEPHEVRESHKTGAGSLMRK